MGLLASMRRRVGAFIGGFGGSGFEGAASGRRLRNFQPTPAHINTKLSASGATLIARARWLALNNGYCNNAVEVWATSTVGSGITPLFKFANKAQKKAVIKAWSEFVDECDAEGLSDFYGLLRRGSKEMMTAGEVFYRFRARRPEDGLTIPFQLQMLPSEMLPRNMNEPGRNLDGTANGNTIRAGIEFDAIGKRVAYHFFRKHPGDVTEGGFTGTGIGSRAETVRVPAEDVLHLIDPIDAGQLRGVPRFAPGIVKAHLLDLYDDAELDRKKVAALHALFVETETPEDWDPEDNETAADIEPPALDLQPGLVTFLKPGEKVTTSSPADSGTTYEPFQYRTLLQLSAALGIPYPMLTNDVRQATFASQRAAIIDFRRRVETFQHAILVFQFCRPVIGRFLDIGILAGAFSLPTYERRRKEYTASVSWLPPKWEWVDPLKDVNAELAMIRGKLKSRSQAIAERGYDPETVDEQIAEEREREARLGIEGEPGPDASAPMRGVDDGQAALEEAA
jgi:lambda family phage portal protein